jgi:carboxymethylenebutenolidase
MDHALSRRQIVVTALGSGFALAVRPVAAGTITTDDRGLEAGPVKIPTKDGDIPAYRAQPAKKKDPPVILVVQEIFGVHEHIRDLCRRLAKVGYLAVAPELYARQGDVSKLTDMAQIRPVVAKVPDAQVMGDLDATADWARKSGGHATKLGITGFCWGGRIVWLYAAHNARLTAGAAWYGRLVGERDPLHPKHPVDVAAALKAPVLGLYGGKDQGIPQDTVEQMRAALKAANANAKKPPASEIKVYPEAGHAFLADYRPSYVKEAAEDGWNQMLTWFRQHGLGG